MSKKLFFPATQRNREPICEVLKKRLSSYEKSLELAIRDFSILEVASGSGEHVTFFAQNFPQTQWQPSDIVPEHLESIEAWVQEEKLPNVLPPLFLDVLDPASIEGSWHAILCCNMIHIAPWEATQGLFSLAKKVVKEKGWMALYGPFRREGKHTSESNRAFNLSLKQRNPQWGVRDLEEVEKIARPNDFVLDEVIAMPANNFMVFFQNTK